MSILAANSESAERTTSYTYDAVGRLKTVVEDLTPQNIVDDTLDTTYGYDLRGNLARTDLPNGVIESYVYDQLNRLDVLTHFAPDGTPLDLSDNAKKAEFDYSVRADGKRTSAVESFWLDDDNNPSTADVLFQNTIDWKYDAIGRLVEERFDHFDNSVDQTENFFFDLAGNRIRQKTDLGNTGTIDEAITYLFDANDRLTSEQLDSDNNGTVDQTTTFDYDQTQRSSKTVTNSVGTVTSTQTFAYNLQGRMAEVTITDSASGGKTVTSYEYDSKGIRVASTTKTDADGNGSFESEVRTEHLVDHRNHTGYAQTIRETETDLLTGNVTKTIDYTFGQDEISQTVTLYNADGSVASTETHIFGHDGHGSVRVLYDMTAAIAQLYSFDAYGNMLAVHNGAGALVGTDASAALTSLLYSGETFDFNIGQQYLRARFYDLGTGTFNRLDPFFGNLRDPQSLHKYLYVHGDPIQYTDPLGLGIGLGGLSLSMRIAIGVSVSVGVFGAFYAPQLTNTLKGIRYHNIINQLNIIAQHPNAQGAEVIAKSQLKQRKSEDESQYRYFVHGGNVSNWLDFDIDVNKFGKYDFGFGFYTFKADVAGVNRAAKRARDSGPLSFLLVVKIARTDYDLLDKYEFFVDTGFDYDNSINGFRNLTGTYVNGKLGYDLVIGPEAGFVRGVWALSRDPKAQIQYKWETLVSKSKLKPAYLIPTI